MYISRVTIKGFRNFKDAEINLCETSLLIGSNDIGKSNFLYAIRILLDRSLSEADIDPRDSDFYVHEQTDEIEILIRFEAVDEDCVVAKMREHVSDDGVLYLAYKAIREPVSGKKTRVFYAGISEEKLTEIESRFYLKVLNLKFIASKRDLNAFIRHERRNLIQEARLNRSEEEMIQDNENLQSIESDLDTVTESVRKLSYVMKATEGLNEQLLKLSHHHSSQSIVFDIGQSDPAEFVENLRLASQVNGKNLLVGGDGRNNQIQLALWAARNNILDSDVRVEFCIFCIEEPETHLHPHQQRKLAQYLSETLQAQVIITTHSPQIACQVPPESIIRLYNNQPDTKAAGNGMNPFTEAALINFGYRLNIIPAEAFFSSVVLLVEGPSEELFYKALAKALDIDLDRLNISILMVDGIGFLPYASLLNSLNIQYVVRTDNDIFKIKGKPKYRFAGLQRGISIALQKTHIDEKCPRLFAKVDLLGNIEDLDNISREQQIIANRFRKILEHSSVFLAEKDLENDLYSALPQELKNHFGEARKEEVIKQMQKRKATSMFDFLKSIECRETLRSLSCHVLAKPLLRCKVLAEE